MLLTVLGKRCRSFQRYSGKIIRLNTSVQFCDINKFTQIHVLTDIVAGTSDSEDESLSDNDTDNTCIQDMPKSTAKANTQKLIQEQMTDHALTICYKLASRNNSRYYFKDGILFHRGVVAGQDCEQLCAPVNRRTQVLTLAHKVYI